MGLGTVAEKSRMSSSHQFLSRPSGLVSRCESHLPLIVRLGSHVHALTLTSRFVRCEIDQTVCCEQARSHDISSIDLLYFIPRHSTLVLDSV